MAKKRKKTPDPTRVSFRLDDETAAELARRAAEVHRSHGQYARDLLAESLFHYEEQQQELKLIRCELAKLHLLMELLLALRTDLASSVRILLANAGRLHPDQADQWVRKTLLSKPPFRSEEIL